MGGTGGVAWCHLRGLGTRYDIKIKTENFFEKTFFSMKILFSKKYENRKFSKKSHFSKKKYHFFSLIFHWKKWLFWRNFSDFFSREKIFFVQLFVSKKCSNFFLKSNFWSRFFSNICAVWFPVDWACFWINPGHQKRSSSIFVRGGATCRLPPPCGDLWLRALTLRAPKG